MQPNQIEQLIVDRMKTATSIPMFAFSASPNALNNIGEFGIGLVVYAGSSNTPQNTTGPILIKREISITIVFYTEQIEQAHTAINATYTALLNYYADDISPIVVESDEINATEEGFYQSVITINTTTYTR